jgi:outer membrane protein assembly factor BamB
LKTRIATALLAALLASCSGGKLAQPPVLFPVTTAWTAALDALIDPPLGTDGARLFVATRDGFVQAFALADGKPAWKTEAGPGHLTALPGGVVLREEDGTLARLDPETGAIVWKAQSGIAGTAAPVIDRELVFVGGAGLAALSAADGHRVWIATDGTDVTAPPVPSGARLFVGEEDGTLRCRDRATGNTLWAFKTSSAVRAPVFVDQERRLLLGTTEHRFIAVSADKGKRSWQWKLGADVQHGSVALGDSVLFASLEDVLYCLDRTNGHMRWRAVLPSRPLAAPVLTGSAVIVACHEANVVGFDARSGRRLGALTTSAEIRTPPIVVADRLYIGLRDRSIVALALDQTEAKQERAPAKGQRGEDREGGKAGKDKGKNRNPFP